MSFSQMLKGDESIVTKLFCNMPGCTSEFRSTVDLEQARAFAANHGWQSDAEPYQFDICGRHSA